MMMVDGSRKEQSRTEQQGFCSEGGGSGDGGGGLFPGDAHILRLVHVQRLQTSTLRMKMSLDDCFVTCELKDARLM